MKQYKMGYMTLEATIIITFAVFILGSLIELGLLCYTKVFYEQNAYLAVLHGSKQLLMGNTEVKTFVSREWDELLGNHFLTVSEDAEITVRLGKIKIKQAVGPFEVKAEAKQIYPARTIRAYERTRNLLGEGGS